eukprot:COSAG06_NODE_163_length_21566_cov_9.641070_19_plen_46_part_00
MYKLPPEFYAAPDCDRDVDATPSAGEKATAPMAPAALVLVSSARD